MDYIKKIICIEGARTRTQGLMPYYEFGKEYSEHKGGGCGSISSLGLEKADGGNGNWGHFVANPCFLGTGKTYEGMLHAYYSLLNMVRDGVKLRKVETKEGEIIFTEDVGAFEWNNQCFEGGEEPETLYVYAAYDAKNFYSTDIESLREETKHIYRSNINVSDVFIVLIEDFEKFNRLAAYLDGTGYSQLGTGINIGSGKSHLKWARYCQVIDFCIGKINIPASIYNKHIKVPKSMPCADVEPYIDWLENYEALSADCCNARLYEDMGGKEFLNYLKNTARGKCSAIRNKLESIDYRVPYISMPLLLTQNTTDVGVLTNIDGVKYKDNEKRPHHDSTMLTGFTIDDIHMGTGVVSINNPIEVESLLNTLRTPKKYTDDKDNVLPGLFIKFGNPAGEMYACVKRSNEKFYQLTKEPYVIIENGQNKTYWRVIYTEATMTRDDIYGLNNLNHSELPGPLAISLTEEQANDIIQEQQTHYQDVEKSVPSNPYVYKICVSLANWEMYDIGGEPQDSVNGDGLQSQDVSQGGTRYPASGEEWRNASGKVYRTITAQDAGIRIAETEEEETGNYVPKDYHYFFFVKYNNTSGSPMDIPFKVGNTANVYLVTGNTYRGDFITNISTTGGKIKIEYVIGGYFRGDEHGKFISRMYPQSGDEYYEEYVLDENHVDLVALDGVDNVKIYSRYIDFEGAAKEFYSPRYNLYRTGNTAYITRLTTGDIWSKIGYDAYLAKEEYLTGFSLPPKVDVNVTVDRGGVSVFEKHYKLAECNTMQDLVNYGNNFFNL